MECSICLDPLTDQPEDEAVGGTTCYNLWTNQSLKPGLCCTPCGHLFHRPCLELWFKSSARRQSHRTCPFCRKKIDYLKLYPVYLDVNKIRKPIIDKQAATCRGSSGSESRSLFSLFKRMFSRSSPSTSQQPVTQLQVAVTINCVQPSPTGSPSSSTSTTSQPVEQVSVSICRDCMNNCLMQKHVTDSNAPPSSSPS